MVTTTHLPKVRRGILAFLVLTSFANLFTSMACLIYQLSYTRGYQTAIPVLFAGSFFLLIFACHFLFTPARLLAKFPEKAALFLRSLGLELAVYAGASAYFLVASINLNTATPGLLSSCGGFTMCQMLIASTVLGWLTWFAVTLSFALIFLSVVYLTSHRNLPIVLNSHQVPFESVDWGIYRSRGVRPLKKREYNPRDPQGIETHRMNAVNTSTGPNTPLGLNTDSIASFGSEMPLRRGVIGIGMRDSMASGFSNNAWDRTASMYSTTESVNQPPVHDYLGDPNFFRAQNTTKVGTSNLAQFVITGDDEVIDMDEVTEKIKK